MRRRQRFRSLQYKAVFKGLNLIEKAITKKYTLKFPPIFIVSPPRSGTTLTRQVLAWLFPTSYFSNFTSMSTLHVGRPLPITTAYLVNRFGQTDLGSFENSYGRSHGRSYGRSYGRSPSVSGSVIVSPVRRMVRVIV